MMDTAGADRQVVFTSGLYKVYVTEKDQTYPINVYQSLTGAECFRPVHSVGDLLEII